MVIFEIVGDTWREVASVWWYNNIRRPLANRRLKKMWISEGRDPEIWGRGIGRIDKKHLAWAKSEVKRLNLK
jgi:hypothetical protein